MYNTYDKRVLVELKVTMILDKFNSLIVQCSNFLKTIIICIANARNSDTMCDHRVFRDPPLVSGDWCKWVRGTK